MYHPVNLVSVKRIRSSIDEYVCILGHGVDKLLDDNLETYWQSDGPQPHLVNIQFKQKTKVKDLCIFRF